MAGDGLRSTQAWIVTVAAVRAVLSASVLVALYYVLPLDLDDSDVSTIAKLTLGVFAFVGLMTWNVRAITQSDNPGCARSRASWSWCRSSLCCSRRRTT